MGAPARLHVTAGAPARYIPFTRLKDWVGWEKEKKTKVESIFYVVTRKFGVTFVCCYTEVWCDFPCAARVGSMRTEAPPL